MKLTTKPILLPALLFALLVAGCSQQNTSSGAKTPGTNPSAPSNPNELVEADVLTAFGLQRGSITASAAAKKIATGTPASSITFTERRFIAYNDEAGTFTVKVKGTKNGKSFSQRISVNGFTHPLAGKTIQSLDSCELNLDEGIEHNYSLQKYITEVNKDPSGAKLVKKLSFTLTDGTTIELGEHDRYTLTATAKKGTPDTKILVQPSIVFRKLTEGGTEELTNNTAFEFIHLNSSLTKDYFTEKDVFKYILDRTADIAIKVDSTEFASSFYAAAKSGNSTENLFTDAFKTHVKKYTDLYRIKEADEHLPLDIAYGISQPKTGGINADDYEGKLTVKFCIATHDQLTNQGEITAVKTITRLGYAKITNAAELKNQLFFDVSSKPNPSNEAIKTWKRKFFDCSSLLRIGDDGAAILASNPLPDGFDKPFCLCINGEATLSNYLGCKAYGASRTRNNKVIFIENIQLQKIFGETDLQVKVQLKGSGPILTITTDPGPAYR